MAMDESVTAIEMAERYALQVSSLLIYNRYQQARSGTSTVSAGTVQKKRKAEQHDEQTPARHLRTAI